MNSPTAPDSAALVDSSVPVYSMTGFARVQGTVGADLVWVLTVKSVNHRFLDVHMRMPAGCELLEMRLRKMLKERIRRGHLELTLSISHSGQAGAVIDSTRLRAYLQAFRIAAEENSLSQQPDLNVMLRLPGVVEGENGGLKEERDAVEQAVIAASGALIDDLNAMRAEEGRALASELVSGVERLDEAVTRTAALREGVERAHFDRISQRLADLVPGAAADRNRLLEEAALLAERSDIEEEITRLHTHIRHFVTLVKGGGEMGKKLDFLLQEMNREANTLLSKTSGIAGHGQLVTELGLAMKSEIEKAREQVQNLE